MCNLYRVDKSAAEIARLFGAEVDPASLGANAGGEMFPGQPGWVVAGGRVRAMTWGFPLARRGAKGQVLKPRPVNNARADRLSSPFWRSAFANGRCLIPLDRFAEASGAKGARTRTWFGLEDGTTFVAAGLWRQSAEWGDCYSMVMTEACKDVTPLHERMPVLLSAGERDAWLDAPSPDAALSLCRPWPARLRVTPTDEPWAGRARA